LDIEAFCPDFFDALLCQQAHLPDFRPGMGVCLQTDTLNEKPAADIRLFLTFFIRDIHGQDFSLDCSHIISLRPLKNGFAAFQKSFPLRRQPDVIMIHDIPLTSSLERWKTFDSPLANHFSAVVQNSLLESSNKTFTLPPH
jgi:hypothetical protein